MKLEDIQAEWSKDCVINENDISYESSQTMSLHSKYWKMFSYENILMRKREAELKTLKFEKYEFLTQGPTQETISKGWKLPPIGRILKTDVAMYIDSDKDIIDLTLKLSLQKEKVDFLKSIIDMIKNRGFVLNTILNDQKFKSGG